MKSMIDQLMEQKITSDEFVQHINISRESGNYSSLGLSPSEFELFERLGNDALDEIIAARQHKSQIMERWKNFFRNEIAANHTRNTKKLAHLKEFNLNPFLDTYRANFLLGDSSPKSKATALVYTRALGTSLNTTFGTSLQKFCSDILSGYASVTSGIDIEFIDFIDGRRKYCQIKAGPNTINKDDVKTITDHFSSVKNLARTNHLDIGLNDLIVGVFYGTKSDLSTHYKKLQKDFPVYIGQDFWYRLTGDPTFYKALTDVIDEVSSEYDGRDFLADTINKLAKEIEESEES